MRWIALSFVLLLFGCASESERAEERYRMVERAKGTDQEQCEAANKIVAAYLQEGNEPQYRRWKPIAEVNCLNARIGSAEPLPSGSYGDNLTAVDAAP